MAVAPETPEPPKRGNHGGESVRCISLPGTLEARLEGAFHFLFSVSPQGLTLEDPTGDPGSSSAGEKNDDGDSTETGLKSPDQSLSRDKKSFSYGGNRRLKQQVSHYRGASQKERGDKNKSPTDRGLLTRTVAQQRVDTT